MVALVFPKFRDARPIRRPACCANARLQGRAACHRQRAARPVPAHVRCGFDALDVAKEADAQAVEKELKTYSVFYQPTGDGRPTRCGPASRRRARSEARRVRACDQMDLADEAARLAATLEGASPLDVLERAIGGHRGRIAAVSSFGTGIGGAAAHDRAGGSLGTGAVPRHRPSLTETLDYRDTLIAGSASRTCAPTGRTRRCGWREMPKRPLGQRDTDACLRPAQGGAARPCTRALRGLDQGRKRYQAVNARRTFRSLKRTRPHQVQSPGGARAGRYRGLDDTPRPAAPSHAEVRLRLHRLHALHVAGKPGEDPRAGRWRGQAKTECGIHVPKDSEVL